MTDDDSISAFELAVGDWIVDRQGQPARVVLVRPGEVGERPCLYLNLNSYRSYERPGKPDWWRAKPKWKVKYLMRERVARSSPPWLADAVEGTRLSG